MTRRTKPDTQQTVRAVLADVLAELAGRARVTPAPAGTAGLAQGHTVVAVENGCLDSQQPAADRRA
jgi:hypothetical protein